MTNTIIRLFSAAALSLGMANAAVIVFTDSLAFQNAATISNTADFEGLPVGTYGGSTLLNGGISFELLPGARAATIYVAAANTLTNTAQNPTEALTASGDENFRIRLTSGNPFTAIGFDFISNAFAPAVVDFFDAANNNIGHITLSQAANSVGFFGATSDIAIDHIDTTVTGGYIQDTGYDNVQVGVSSAPEPTTAVLVFGGLAVLLGSSLRKKA